MVFASGSLLFILGFAQPDVKYTECSVCSPDACGKKTCKLLLGYRTRTHDLLLSSADVLTTRPLNSPVATGWFEYVEQWVLQTIFHQAKPKMNNKLPDAKKPSLKYCLQYPLLDILNPASRHRQVRWTSG